MGDQTKNGQAHRLSGLPPNTHSDENEQAVGNQMKNGQALRLTARPPNKHHDTITHPPSQQEKSKFVCSVCAFQIIASILVAPCDQIRQNQPRCIRGTQHAAHI